MSASFDVLLQLNVSIKSSAICVGDACQLIFLLLFAAGGLDFAITSQAGSQASLSFGFFDLHTKENRKNRLRKWYQIQWFLPLIYVGECGVVSVYSCCFPVLQHLLLFLSFFIVCIAKKLASQPMALDE